MQQLIRRSALAVAHPGHEIRIHGWLESVKPVTYVLTDGSGQRGVSRINSTLSLLQRTGCSTGCLFGEKTDREIYDLVLNRSVNYFLNMAERLATEWIERDIDCVLADFPEGAIMAHDLFHGVVDCAARIGQSLSGRRIQKLTFCLERDPRASPTEGMTCLRRTLDDQEFARKVAAAQSYVGLESEVHRAFATWGQAAFRHELLIEQFLPTASTVDPKPAYEVHGESMVRRGVYSQVVRYRDHVKPILDELQGRSCAA